jgi:preprotein translocase subunit SecA
MFGSMMTGIAQDFVKYVMHVQVVQNQPQAQPTQTVQNVQTSSSDDVESTGFDRAASAAVAEGELPPEAAPAQPTSTKQKTIVKDDFSKTPRNAPCPCGSGKKFKQRHGAN